jgi:hypothetical protein
MLTKTHTGETRKSRQDQHWPARAPAALTFHSAPEDVVDSSRSSCAYTTRLRSGQKVVTHPDRQPSRALSFALADISRPCSLSDRHMAMGMVTGREGGRRGGDGDRTERYGARALEEWGPPHRTRHHSTHF